MSRLLELHDVTAGYGPSTVLHGLTLGVDAGETVLLVGRNGMGKSTTLKLVAGWLAPRRGSVHWQGASMQGWPPERAARSGIGYVPEDRRIFPALTVEENLRLGLHASPGLARSTADARIGEACALFPRLRERARQAGRTLSGGEQQMLAIARALVARPRLLLVDEPSEGLAPMVVNEIFGALRALRDAGTALLLVEQNVRRAITLADRVYVIEKGQIVQHGPAAQVWEDRQLRERLAL